MSIRPKDLPYIQAMPPPGGFPEIDVFKSPRPRGPSGMVIWGASTLAIVYGFYKLGVGNRKRTAAKIEERKFQHSIAPILQAEADLDYIQRERQRFKREAEVMKNVPGWSVEPKTYFFSDRWVPYGTPRLNQFGRK